MASPVHSLQDMPVKAAGSFCGSGPYIAQETSSICRPHGKRHYLRKKRGVRMPIRFLTMPVILLVAALSPAQTISAAGEDAAIEARRQNFKEGRELLQNKGVPFDPDELLHGRRSKKLKDSLAAMPEMRETRYETAPLNGAYFADTLYLPEHVKLQGHTIIVVNYLVFEGKQPVIQGNFALNVFPAKPIGVLGTSLAEALRKKSMLVNVSLTGRRDLPSFRLIQELDQKKSPIVFDTGVPRWTPNYPQRKLPVAWHELRAALVQNVDKSGDIGSTGAVGEPGIPGLPGVNLPKGDNGSCVGTMNGSGGGPGGDGTNGTPGGSGVQGGIGMVGGPINVTISDGDLRSYEFKSNGGLGGFGGQGGNGGIGGSGGNGGDGGDAVACGCNVGDGGDAGHGGNGANGGFGGTGGMGGTGGKGGSITLSLPAGSNATTANFGGNGGFGGTGGPGGMGGNAGLPGKPGIGATACGITGRPGESNFPGQPGNSAGSGPAGPNGQEGQPGVISVTYRTPAPPPPPPPPAGCGNVGGDGFSPVNGGAGDDGCSPIVIDTTGAGIRLTSATGGVEFDMRGDGHPIHLAWTAPGSRTAFLALPGNNGIVNNGTQLFGNFTPQPPSSAPNGFAALAVYDQRDHGGNGDGVLDQSDQIFTSLRLWIDQNHDGICQPEELHTLPELGVLSIDLKYEVLGKTDEFGNRFRFKAKVNPGMKGELDIGRKAYDVFFVTR
jgi:hypothetical protein